MSRLARTTRVLARLLVIALGLCATTSAAFARSHVVVISGIGGEDHFSDLFYRWSKTLAEAVQTNAGVPASSIHYLAEDPARDPDLIAGRSTRDEIVATLASVAASADESDNILVVLIGHGSDNGQRVAFNIPGPDLDPDALDQALEVFGQRRVAVVNTTASSAAFANLLSRDGRIVVTATATPAENQHTWFASAFATAFAESGADRNKDRRVSLLEAFEFAVRETARFYETEGRVLTEHAQIDDNGDGRPSREAVEGGDGDIARLFTLEPEAKASASDRKQLALNISARRLVDDIENLKRVKRTMSITEFEQNLEALLIELALNRRAHRKLIQ